MPKTKDALHAKRRRVQLDIELLKEDPPEYQGGHVNGQLTRLQASVLNRYWHAVRGASMLGGRYVESRMDAVRLLLERIAADE